MSRRRSRHGKEKDDDFWRGKEIAEETVEAEDVKELLPERIFATDRFPNKRVNTTDYLSRVRNALNNTLEMAKLIGSCFGGLFKLPAQRLKPLRFPLVGFREVMGLPID
ncbi:BnaA05g13690D [Brassica napus]|uniref:BnaA05g13690D protein n=1 Tax=Brassica napus TaxID=3708 RepID=A0A078F199_BRANA|nr:BnaA05g13690D [Brassica napus]